MTKIIQTAFEYNGLTGQTTVRPFTQFEIEQQITDAVQIASDQALADLKASARDSALAKLSALGLTAEEIASL